MRTRSEDQRLNSLSRRRERSSSVLYPSPWSFCKGPWTSLTTSGCPDRPGSHRRPKNHHTENTIRRGSPFPSRRTVPSCGSRLPLVSYLKGHGLVRRKYLTIIDVEKVTSTPTMRVEIPLSHTKVRSSVHWGHESLPVLLHERETKGRRLRHRRRYPLIRYRWTPTGKDPIIPHLHGGDHHTGGLDPNVFSVPGRRRGVLYRPKDITSCPLGVSTDRPRLLSPRCGFGITSS